MGSVSPEKREKSFVWKSKHTDNIRMIDTALSFTIHHRNHCREESVMPGHYYWTEEEERKVADMVAAGMSQKAIAKEPRRSVGAVKKMQRMKLSSSQGGGGSR